MAEALPQTDTAEDVGLASSLVAATWWFVWHMPRMLWKFHGARVAKKLRFALGERVERVKAVRSDETLAMIAQYREREFAVSGSYVNAQALAAIDRLLGEHGYREAVRSRKRTLGPGPHDPVDIFKLSQEKFSAEASQRLFEILPADLKPALELARGRTLRLVSVTYHETNPEDPRSPVGSTSFNGHPFHIDGNPRFAKVLIYLSDVDENCGPFELVTGSRFPFFDELLRIAYKRKYFRGREGSVAAWCRRHLPRRLRRETHFWEWDAAEIERRYSAPTRFVGKAGTLVFFQGMNVHNGSRDQERHREVLHIIFS